MRHFYKYTRTYSVAVATFKVTSVNIASLTTANNRNDVFCRAMYRDASGKNNLYLTTSLAAAEDISTECGSAALKTAASIFGYHEDFTLDGSAHNFTYTNHAAVAPDMTGIVIGYDGAGSETDWDAVFALDSAPEAAILNEIEYLL